MSDRRRGKGILQLLREALTDDADQEPPITYDEASTGNIADQMDRYRELADHDIMACSIATLKARGTFEPNEHVNDEKFPPLTTRTEHLEMLALGERIARYYRHPAQVDKAVRAGATWEQIAAATGTTEDATRAAYREWADGQHRLYADMGHRPEVMTNTPRRSSWPRRRAERWRTLTAPSAGPGRSSTA